MKVEIISSVLILLIAVVAFSSFGLYDVNYSGRATDPITSCSDSDAGSSDGGIFKFGKLIGSKNGVSFTYYDSCVDGSTLKEYSCSDLQPISTNHPCAVGCSTGACVKPFVDLVVSNLVIDRVEHNSPANASAKVFFTYTAKNRGNVPITSIATFFGNVQLKQIVPFTNEASITNLLSVLGADQEKSYSGVASCRIGEDSPFSLTATVDSYGGVAESIETNNQKVVEGSCNLSLTS